MIKDMYNTDEDFKMIEWADELTLYSLFKYDAGDYYVFEQDYEYRAEDGDFKRVILDEIIIPYDIDALVEMLAMPAIIRIHDFKGSAESPMIISIDGRVQPQVCNNTFTSINESGSMTIEFKKLEYMED